MRALILTVHGFCIYEFATCQNLFVIPELTLKDGQVPVEVKQGDVPPYFLAFILQRSNLFMVNLMLNFSYSSALLLVISQSKMTFL